MSSTTDFNSISFDLPKNQSNVIKVIGVGGGGSNAINHMFQQGIKGVDFVICNTDSQALQNSPVPVKIQLGISLTEGLGAGANPKIGEQSAVESMEEIQNMLSTNTKMVFITAGMGGGTGTGAAPIIAQMAKELDILTVGIVTIPFNFEGKTRNEQAQLGLEKLRQNVDSLIVINNNKLREVYGNLGFKSGFSKADEVLATAARGIAEVITHHYTQNIDLRDAKTVLSNSGTAIMGSASASGANRAKEAIERALDSPLLNDNKIKGAKNVLLLIVFGSDEITIDEIGEISDHIQNEAGHSANIIMGVGEDENLEKAITITIIATGFNVEQQNEIVNTESKKIIHLLDDEKSEEQDLTPVSDSNFPKFNSEDESQIIRHTLIDDTTEENTVNNFSGYIKTSEFLKQLDVHYHEILPENLADFEDVSSDDNEFIIYDSSQKENSEETQKSKNSQMLMFDLPSLKSDSNKGVQEIPSTSGQTARTKDSSEILIEKDENKEIKKYNLEDYEDFENESSKAKPSIKEEIEEEEDVFTKYTLSEPKLEEKVSDENLDPVNTPIANLLRDRSEERRKKMKEFNYKFKNSNSHIDEIEKQPAYKRKGVELNDVKNQSQISRISLNVDEDEIELRKNNSFLHDNVD